MRPIPASNKSLTGDDLANTQSKSSNPRRPDWMKKLQEQRKQQKEQAEQQEEEEEEEICTKNCDLNLFQSFNKSISSQITYLDDEDDLAASYFPGATKMGSSHSSLDSDDLPAVSGYHFDELIEKDVPSARGK